MFHRTLEYVVFKEYIYKFEQFLALMCNWLSDVAPLQLLLLATNSYVKYKY